MKRTPDGGYVMERADKEKELRQLIDRLTVAIDNVQIAMNILREHYGVEFCAVSLDGSGHHRVQLACGVNELGKVLGRDVTLDTGFGRASKKFRYDWTEFVQLAEYNTMDFLPLNFRAKALYDLNDGEETKT